MRLAILIVLLAAPSFAIGYGQPTGGPVDRPVIVTTLEARTRVLRLSAVSS